MKQVLVSFELQILKNPMNSEYQPDDTVST